MSHDDTKSEVRYQFRGSSHNKDAQRKFVAEVQDFLNAADKLSDRYKVHERTGHDSRRFFNVEFFDENQKLKTVFFVDFERDKETDATSILIVLRHPRKISDHGLYFVDVKDIVSQAARKHGVKCTSKAHGVFKFADSFDFKTVRKQFRDFMIDVEKNIREEPLSLENQSRYKPRKLVRVPVSTPPEKNYG